MTLNSKKKEYIIMDKNTGHVIHEGADRRSILPNHGDFKTQMVLMIAGVLLSGFLGLLAYAGDTAYKGVIASIGDLKASNESSFQKIWAKINTTGRDHQNQFDWVLQQCCAGAKTNPPPLTQ